MSSTLIPAFGIVGAPLLGLGKMKGDSTRLDDRRRRDDRSNGRAVHFDGFSFGGIIVFTLRTNKHLNFQFFYNYLYQI